MNPQTERTNGMRTDEAARRVLAALRFGVRSRAGLRAAAGVSDREVRRAVRELVLTGTPIVTAKGGGYRLAEGDEAGLMRDVALLESRIRALAVRIAALKRCRPSEYAHQLALALEDPHAQP